MKLGIFNFWTPDFNPKCNYLTELFRSRYDITLLEANEFHTADLIIFGGNPKKILRQHKDSWLPGIKKIAVSQEPPWIYPTDPHCADVVLSMNATSGNNINFPHWILYVDWFNKTNDVNYMNCSGSLDPVSAYTNRVIPEKTKFATMIARWNGRSQREAFTQAVSSYKHVDCPGELLHNCDFEATEHRNSDFPGAPSRPGDKLEFMKPYKFNITFENSYYSYYTTEKLLQPYAVGCIPIYWGAVEGIKRF